MSGSAKPESSKMDKHTLCITLQVGNSNSTGLVKLSCKTALNFRYLVAQISRINMVKDRHVDRLAVKQRKNKQQKQTFGERGEERIHIREREHRYAK